MNQHIVAYDCETTGLSHKEDYIIQLSAVKFDRETFETIEEKNWYIKPTGEYSITQQAFLKHGIKKEWLDNNGESMSMVAPKFIKLCEGCDILSFNGNAFDIKFIMKDFQAAGYNFDLSGRKFYDSFAMEAKLFPRTLEATYKKYTGEELENAHNALADTQATVQVFKHQLKKLDLKWDDIDGWDENNIFAPEGMIKKTKKNDGSERMEIVFTAGKYRNFEFMKVCRRDPDYVKWYMTSIASDYTKPILKEYYWQHREDSDSM